MWNNLRARHYSVLVLLAIVALETFAIAVDRLVLADCEEAFVIESSFQNNSFIQSFRIADASCAVLPVRINDLVTAHDNKSCSFADFSAPSAPSAAVSSNEANLMQTGEKKVVTISKSLSAEFVAGANVNDNYSNFVEYSVQPGDSLSNIALLFGSKTDVIKEANKLDNSNNIRAGQTIKVPMQTAQMRYTVKKGDSLSRIASRFNISMEALIKENNLKSHVLMPDQKIIIPIDNSSNIKMIKMEKTKESSIVKNKKLGKVEDSTKLQIVKLNNQFPVAAAVSSVKKAEISFGKEESLNIPAPKITVRVNKPETVELKIEKPVKASLVHFPESLKDSAAVESSFKTVFASKAEDVADEISETLIYTVGKGDNLSKIANKFNTTIAQIQADNDISGDILKIGQNLKVNPNKKLFRVAVKAGESEGKKEVSETKVVMHKVKNGESLSVLAKRYNTTVAAIINENSMTNTVVMAGQTLKIPSKKNKNFKITSISSTTSSKYAWKTPTKGWLSSPYGWRNHPVRKKRTFHAGIDLAAPKGTGIYCVAPGRVIYTGTRSGYGKLVIVSHEKGLSTRYAHCSQILVKNGQLVKEGQLLAKVGATGIATGNHLHFEVRKNGKTQNPINYLKR